jgi:hypothetical protein
MYIALQELNKKIDLYAMSIPCKISEHKNEEEDLAEAGVLLYFLV